MTTDVNELVAMYLDDGDTPSSDREMVASVVRVGVGAGVMALDHGASAQEASAEAAMAAYREARSWQRRRARAEAATV